MTAGRIESYSDFLAFNDAVPLDNYYHFAEGFSSDEADQIVELGLSRASVSGVTGGGLNPAYRSSDVSWIELAEDSLWLYKKLGALAAKANGEMWNFSVAAMSEKLQFTEYFAGKQGHYDWHMDLGAKFSRRKLSMVVQLTDPAEYEGGHLELRFRRSVNQIVRKKGHVTVFPSYALHRVTPVTEGRRQSLVVWVSGEPFR